MTTILALDTATNACSAAFWADGTVLAERHELMVRGHAERLVPMLAEISAEASVAAKEADLIAVTVGPGAFTGLRVGLAAARGLALAAGVPCFGLTTTDCIAAAVDRPVDGLVVALDSKRRDLYVQVFGPDGVPLTEPAAVAPEGLVGVVADHLPADAVVSVAGDCGEHVAELLAAADYRVRDSGIRYPDAGIVAGLAGRRWSPGQEVPRPTPVYLRPPDAVVPAHGGRLRP